MFGRTDNMKFDNSQQLFRTLSPEDIQTDGILNDEDFTSQLYFHREDWDDFELQNLYRELIN